MTHDASSPVTEVLSTSSAGPTPDPGKRRRVRAGDEMRSTHGRSYITSSSPASTPSALGRDQSRRAEDRGSAGPPTSFLSSARNNLLNRTERERLVNEVLDETFGLGPLEPLMRDPTISDILINGHKTVYIERNGVLEQADISFTDERHLLHIIQRIVSQAGRRVDETSPMVDSRLADGSRVNAIIPPLALDGALVSIRRFGSKPIQAADLVAKKSIPLEMLNFLAACVRARLNVLVSGGTGSGKTTLLNVLSSYIPNEERVITIEDAAELKMQQKHVGRPRPGPRTSRESERSRRAISSRTQVLHAARSPRHRRMPRPRAPGTCSQAMNTGHEGSADYDSRWTTPATWP